MASALESIIASAEAVKKLAADNAAAQVQKEIQAKKLSDKEQGIYDTVANNVAIISGQQQQAKLQIQQKKAEVAFQQGVDVTATTDRMSRLNADIAKTSDELVATAKQAKEQREGWGGVLMGALEGFSGLKLQTGAEAKVPQLQSIMTAQQAALTAMNKNLQESFQTLNGLEAATSAEAAKAAADNAVLAVRGQAVNAEQQALATNGIGVAAALGAAKDVLNAAYSVRQAQLGEEEAGRARQRHAWAADEASLRKEMKEAALAEKQNKAEFEAMSLQWINASRGTLGLPALSGPEARFALTSLKDNKAMQLHWKHGQVVAMNGGLSVLAGTPAESLKLTETLGENIKGPRGVVLQAMRQVQTQVLSNKLVDPKDPTTGSKISAAINQQFANELANPRNSKDNIFNLGDIGKIAPQIAALQDNPVVQKIIAPQAKNGVSFEDPSTVLSLLTSAVKNKNLTTTEAGKLAEVYQRLQEANLESYGIREFGITLPNDGRQYVINAGFMKGKIDMTKPEEIIRYITKQQAEEAAKKVTVFSTPVGLPSR